MKAQVFCIESQKDCCDRIEDLLKKFVYLDIKVQITKIDENYGNQSGKESHDAGKEYRRLFKASILKFIDPKVINRDFNIVVKNDAETTWCYLGYNYEGGDAFLKLTHSEMSVLFPAVAIMDQMVMVPEKIMTGLDKYPRDFLWFPKPLEFGGVALVDFGDDYSLEKAIKLVGARFKSEIKKLNNRYMVVNHVKIPNLEELGKLLDVKESYLKTLENDSLFTTAQLSAGIVSNQAVSGKSSKVTLKIQNESDKSLDQVRVRVNAPVNILEKPVSKIRDSLPPHEAIEIELQVLPKTSPYCPLEVIADIVDGTEDFQLFPIPVILEVKDKG